MAVTELDVACSDVSGSDAVERWNANVPDGSSVVVDVHGTKVRTKTRGLAFMLNGKPMITLLGVAGAVDIDLVTVTPWRKWVKLNRRGQVNHWIECDFESEDAMWLQLNEQMRLDPRIVSFETSTARPIDA